MEGVQKTEVVTKVLDPSSHGGKMIAALHDFQLLSPVSLFVHSVHCVHVYSAENGSACFQNYDSVKSYLRQNTPKMCNCVKRLELLYYSYRQELFYLNQQFWLDHDSRVNLIKQ